jgi:hypothetical protein
MSSKWLEQKEVVDAIQRAFASVKYPGDNNIITNREDLESLEIESLFPGMDWHSLCFDTVFKYRDSLPFLTSVAFGFYLPAYMINALVHYQESDTLPEYVVYQLAPPKHNAPKQEQEWFDANIVGLTADQREAIALFLEYLWQRHSADFPNREPYNALDQFWKRN